MKRQIPMSRHFRSWNLLKVSQTIALVDHKGLKLEPNSLFSCPTFSRDILCNNHAQIGTGNHKKVCQDGTGWFIFRGASLFSYLRGLNSLYFAVQPTNFIFLYFSMLLLFCCSQLSLILHFSATELSYLKFLEFDLILIARLTLKICDGSVQNKYRQKDPNKVLLNDGRNGNATTLRYVSENSQYFFELYIEFSDLAVHSWTHLVDTHYFEKRKKHWKDHPDEAARPKIRWSRSPKPEASILIFLRRDGENWTR